MKADKVSAAIALVRGDGPARQVMLVHPGGPFWAKKDLGSWSLPKGLVEPGEEPLATALREWTEETGFAAPAPPHVQLGQIVQKSGKRVIAFAARGDVDPAAMRSNEIDIEWPPKSGKKLRIPECDRAAFFDRETALGKVLEGQRPLVEKAFDVEL
jgi:predicted NUDIX family NTP pyrophosphohydrolase